MWTNPEGIILGEISHRMTSTLYSHLYELAEVVKIIKSEWNRGSQGLGGEEMGS